MADASDALASPLLRTAVPCALVAVALQAAVGLPSTLLVLPPSERFYDLSGAATHVTVALLSLCLPRWRAVAETGATAGGVPLPSLPPLPPLPSLPSLPSPHWRQLALSGAVVLWAIRLGAYLFRRMLREGRDSRFDALRAHRSKVLVAWAAQALWVVLCQAPVTAVNAADAGRLPDAVLWTDAVGFALFAAGLALECVADAQKARWQAAKHAKQHDEVFLARGLFARSRYPHYFGETTLWTGLAVVAAGVLARGPVRASLGGLSTAAALATAAVSPAFTAFVLLRLSGVALSEPKYDRLYGHRADYQAWKRDTPRFVPRLF